MPSSPDVLILGGGIIGLTSAYFLAKAGLKVELIEKGEPGKEASWAGAGIIPPGNPDKAATPIDKLRGIGSKEFPRLTAELHDRTGIDSGYRACGGVEVLDAEDETPFRWRTEGIAVERWTGDELRRHEPSVRLIAGVPYFLPTCAQVRNPWHLRALLAACAAPGVTIRSGTAAEGWTAAGVRLADGTVRSAGRYVVAAGAWTKSLLHPLGCFTDVHPVRGQILLLRCQDNPIRRILMVRKRYLVPRGDGLVLVGSTEEPEAGFEKQTTVEGIEGLAYFADSLVPGLIDAHREAAWAGLRPGSPDGLPFLGPVPGHDHVFAAVGHFRAGVQLSIGTAEVVTAWATGIPFPVSLDPFRLDRQPDFSFQPAFRS